MYKMGIIFETFKVYSRVHEKRNNLENTKIGQDQISSNPLLPRTKKLNQDKLVGW